MVRLFKYPSQDRLLPVYLVALVLVIGVGVLALIKLNQIKDNLDILTNELAVDRALSKDIVSQILLPRFYANRYVRTQSQADLDRYNEAFANLDALLSRAGRLITNPQRAAMLSRINTTVEMYGATFEDVSMLVQNQQRVYDEVIDIQGLAFETTLTALRIHIAFLGEGSTSLAFGNVQAALHQMHLSTVRYLEEGDEKYAAIFEVNYQEALTLLHDLEVRLEEPEHREQVMELGDSMSIFYEGFQMIRADYARLRELLATMFDVLEPEISAAASEIATSIDLEFQAQNASSKALIGQTRFVLLVVTASAVLAGLGLGLVLNRYIAERYEAEQALRGYQDHLEHLVAARTAALTASNEQLRQEIAERERAEVALRQSETSLAQAQEIAHIGSWSWDIVEDRLEWSDEMYRLLGCKPGEPPTPTFDLGISRTHPDDRTAVQDTIQACRERGDAGFEMEFRTVPIDGQCRILQIQARLERGADGALTRLFGIDIDVTERHRTELALRQSKAAAEEANRAKSVFLANMSHELRTPLNAVLGFSQLMTRDPNLTPEQRDNLEIIQRSGEHLLALINDVLDLSRIEAGRVDVKPEPFDLHEMLLGLGEMFRLRADSKGLTVVFDLAPDVPQYIQADAGKLRQVLINLLGNAVKFTEHGGVTLTVVPSSRRISTDDLAGARRSATLHFEVRDTGVGIASDELDQLFDAFVQTESGRRSQQGTGLGLPISRQYVRMMGGDLSVRSELGKGSCFFFELSFEPPAPEEITSLQLAGSRRQILVDLEFAPRALMEDAYRILVVDDVASSRRLLEKLLTPLGFSVRTACDGQQAVALWEAWRPHLIFMDMRMPVMDGRTATQLIKSRYADIAPSEPEPIIVALTSSAFETDRTAILSSGCDDFISKPFRDIVVFEALERYLDVHFNYTTAPDTLTDVADRSSYQDLIVCMAAQPEPVRAALADAALNGDIERLERLVEEVRAQDAVLADALDALTYEFAYDQIMQLVEGGAA